MSHFPIQHGRHVGLEARDNVARAAAQRVAVSGKPDASQSEAEVWLASLPMPLCARSLARLAPEIAERIAAVWSDVSLTDLLLEQLLVSHGLPRLPSAVLGELLRLYEYNARCRVNDAPDTTWELPVSRHRCPTPKTACQGNQS